MVHASETSGRGPSDRDEHRGVGDLPREPRASAGSGIRQHRRRQTAPRRHQAPGTRSLVGRPPRALAAAERPAVRRRRACADSGPRTHAESATQALPDLSPPSHSTTSPARYRTCGFLRLRLDSLRLQFLLCRCFRHLHGVGCAMSASGRSARCLRTLAMPAWLDFTVLPVHPAALAARGRIRRALRPNKAMRT